MEHPCSKGPGGFPSQSKRLLSSLMSSPPFFSCFLPSATTASLLWPKHPASTSGPLHQLCPLPERFSPGDLPLPNLCLHDVAKCHLRVKWLLITHSFLQLLFVEGPLCDSTVLGIREMSLNKTEQCSCPYGDRL